MLAQMTHGEQLKELLQTPKNIVISGHVIQMPMRLALPWPFTTTFKPLGIVFK